jgi:hypothetical protein
MDTAEKLIQEILDDHPINRCADNGRWCLLCGSSKKKSRGYGLWDMIHSKDCWLVRASTLLGKEPPLTVD